MAVTGAKPYALVDNMNFGNPEKPDVMWQFVEAVEGISEACEALGVPVVGGNVSFYNETDGVDIFPSPVVGMLGFAEPMPETAQPLEKTPDAEAWQRRIREFHRRGSALAPTPWLPLRPAVLGSLGDALRERSLHPFALMRSEAVASPARVRRG